MIIIKKPAFLLVVFFILDGVGEERRAKVGREESSTAWS